MSGEWRGMGGRRLRLAVVLAVVVAVTLPSAPALASGRVHSPDKVAESNVRIGVTAGLVYWVDNGTLTGFDAAQAATIEPSLTWADGDAVAQGIVNIGWVSGSGKRFMVETLSPSGTSFCVARVMNRAHNWWAQGKDTAGGTFRNFHGCRHAPSGSW